MALRPTQVPCVFRGSFVRTDIDPRVQLEWRAATGKEAPFGALRKMWKSQHCLRLGDGTPETCPYSERDCGMAFLLAVRQALRPDIKSRTGYFRVVSKSMALTRADEKPRSRDAETPTPIVAQGAAGLGHHARRDGDLPGGAGDGIVPGVAGSPGVDLHRPTPSGRRPVSIGSVLGSFDVRPRSSGTGSEEA